VRFDEAFRGVQEVVDMPDAQIRLMVRLLMQNGGRLAEGGRQLFTELTDEEIGAIESRVAGMAPRDEGGSLS
jgi:hypothetical protein